MSRRPTFEVRTTGLLGKPGFLVAHLFVLSRQARGIAQGIAGALGEQLELRDLGQIRRNPTLVHHGLADHRGANFHVVFDHDGSPLADIYQIVAPEHTRPIVQAMADVMGEPLRLLDNELDPERIEDHPARLIAPLANPVEPVPGEVWATLRGVKSRVIAVTNARVQVLHLDSGNRAWLGRSEFLAEYRPPRTRPNPSRSKRARAHRAVGREFYGSRKIRRAAASVRIGGSLARKHYLEDKSRARLVARDTANTARRRLKHFDISPNPRVRYFSVTDATGREFWTGEATSKGEALMYAERSQAGVSDPPEPWKATVTRRPKANPKGRELSVPEKHQLRIARDTLKMTDAMARVMGGPSKDEAREIILRLTGRPATNPDWLAAGSERVRAMARRDAEAAEKQLWKEWHTLTSSALRRQFAMGLHESERATILAYINAMPWAGDPEAEQMRQDLKGLSANPARRDIPPGKVLRAEYGTFPPEDRVQVEKLNSAWSPQVRAQVTLARVSPGWEMAGSAARWTNGYFGVSWNAPDGARHGRQYKTLEPAQAHFDKLTGESPRTNPASGPRRAGEFRGSGGSSRVFKSPRGRWWVEWSAPEDDPEGWDDGGLIEVRTRAAGAAFARAWADGKGLGAAMDAAGGPIRPNPEGWYQGGVLASDGWVEMTRAQWAKVPRDYKGRAESWTDFGKTYGAGTPSVMTRETTGGNALRPVRFVKGHGPKQSRGAKQNPRDYVPVAQAAKGLREALKRNFPGVKFSVRSKSYAGGASIRVAYVNGPRGADVDRIAQRFAGADFDGMTDLKTDKSALLVGEGGALREVRYGSDFVFVSRDFSPGLFDAVVAAIGARWDSSQWAKMPDYEHERMARQGLSAIAIPQGESQAVTVERAAGAFFKGPTPNPKGRKRSRGAVGESLLTTPAEIGRLAASPDFYKTRTRADGFREVLHRKGRGKPYVVGVFERLRNPRSELTRAQRTAEMWNEFPATDARRVKVRSRQIPKHLVKLGDLDAVVYRSNKYGGNPKLYEHRFKRPLPVLTSDPDGRVMHIVGGGFKITGDGLVD